MSCVHNWRFRDSDINPRSWCTKCNAIKKVKNGKYVYSYASKSLTKSKSKSKSKRKSRSSSK